MNVSFLVKIINREWNKKDTQVMPYPCVTFNQRKRKLIIILKNLPCSSLGEKIFSIRSIKNVDCNDHDTGHLLSNVATWYVPSPMSCAVHEGRTEPVVPISLWQRTNSVLECMGTSNGNGVQFNKRPTTLTVCRTFSRHWRCTRSRFHSGVNLQGLYCSTLLNQRRALNLVCNR